MARNARHQGLSQFGGRWQSASAWVGLVEEVTESVRLILLGCCQGTYFNLP